MLVTCGGGGLIRELGDSDSTVRFNEEEEKEEGEGGGVGGEVGRELENLGRKGTGYRREEEDLAGGGGVEFSLSGAPVEWDKYKTTLTRILIAKFSKIHNSS